jgi:hypothetical protein
MKDSLFSVHRAENPERWSLLISKALLGALLGLARSVGR